MSSVWRMDCNHPFNESCMLTDDENWGLDIGEYYLV